MSRYEVIKDRFRADLTQSGDETLFSLYLASITAQYPEAAGFVNMRVNLDDMEGLGEYLVAKAKEIRANGLKRFSFVIEARKGSDIEHHGVMEAESVDDCWKQLKADPVYQGDRILKRRIKPVQPNNH